MIDEIAAHESEEAGVFVLQLLEVRVFNIGDDLILECLVHFYHIFVDYPAFIMMEL